mmetsp:Transcript_12734/g.23729  ORF Transcript_12734/g.23729 Transcript_12734/m.23729 type:complete len:271 (+) Transcript_12734:136-948(+)|eukprot:CAMPEP_0204916134 /NCGR_PEP_ID=MMETSP1397-20131031/14024_1 /ASSEMBLY_ACC=CAM_ASM_000891 /TAXON_ID=49980 /ORGANISM="Climacostomum Climacostomum virens, Strain Stock W-24" /LENGTH=270 /DNA_ID=CAMNT_0052088523 /DNA_START=74 /DNA_END=886 /DNA_ORIENTATION=-
MKLVCVTGANKGIGRGIVETLIKEHQHLTVLMTARNSELGLATKGELMEAYPHTDKLHFHQLDITDPTSVSGFLEYVRSSFGHLDVLVNNAGIATKGTTFNKEVASNTLGTNFYATIDFTEKALPLVSEGGSIVFVGSRTGLGRKIPGADLKVKLLNPDITRDEAFELASDFINRVGDGTWTEAGWPSNTYSVSKILLNCYTRALAHQLTVSGRRVRVNVLCPGWVKTDMAGPNAQLTIFEGAAMPVQLVNYEGEETGKFWYDGQMQSFE